MTTPTPQPWTAETVETAAAEQTPTQPEGGSEWLTTPERTIPQEISHNLLAAVRELREWLVGPPAADEQIRTWKICTPEQGEWSGGVWCAEDDCGCAAEGSEIGDFMEGTFTLAQLHEAIGAHIVASQDRKSESANV